MSDLEDILSDDPIEPIEDAPEAVEAEADEPAEVEAEPAEPEAPEPAEDPRDKEIAGLKAALAETRSEVRTLKQPPQSAPKPPDFIDPEGAQFMSAQMAMMADNFRAEISEMKARAKYGDDVIDEAVQAALADGVIDQFRDGKPDPWGRLGKWHSEKQEQAKAKQLLSEIGGDVEAFKAKMRAEILAELKAEQVAESVSQARARPAPSLAGEPNLGSRSAPAWSGPASLDEILNG